MTQPTVTRSRDKTEDDDYHARIARSLASGRAAFYARQGLTPPTESHVRPESSDGLGLPTGERVPRERSTSASVSGPLWTCARESCTKTFRLDRRQRRKLNEGRTNFYCTRECYDSSRKERDHNLHTRIPVDILQKAVVESGLTHAEIAGRLGYYKNKGGGRRVHDGARVAVTLGLRPSRGDHYISTVRRATMDKFAEALGLPERWWIDE